MDKPFQLGIFVLRKFCLSFMKIIIKVLSIILIVFFSFQCKKDPDSINISDKNFLQALIELGTDANGDGLISPEEAIAVTSLNIEDRNISDLQGIEAFVNLNSLICNHNLLTRLDLSNNKELLILQCQSNLLTSINISNNSKLTDLLCVGNFLTTLDISKNPELKVLGCWNNYDIENLDLSNNHELISLGCSNTSITSLDLSNNPKLDNLSCGHNSLTSLDLSNNPVLVALFCENNALTSLNLSFNIKLKLLWCNNNYLTNLDLSNNPELINLNFGNNSLTSLDVSKITALEILGLKSMPALSKVCVWTVPFPPTGVTVDTTDSPNVYFTTDCYN